MIRSSGNSETGKNSSNAALMTSTTASSPAAETRAEPSRRKSPHSPPPMSRTLHVASGRPRAALMAARYASLVRAPDPTWNDTPATVSPLCCAASSSAGTSASVAPYFAPNGSLLFGSSARRRSTSSRGGGTVLCWREHSSAILWTSVAESKVVHRMPASRRCRTSDGRLHGLAKMTSRRGFTKRDARRASVSDAQSKPAPHAASVSTTRASGKHLTA
mmetsp:Transcript_20951/g.83492  ORF Transcript_20951/g.83492 Transcript_20951/m.83492 type:complete len:218 (-) Transcript_20951:419-1072(-)